MTTPWTLTPPHAGEAPTRTWRAVAAVLLFWWGATGLLITMQRSAGTRLAGLLLTAAAVPAGLLLLRRARRGWAARDAVLSFAGGALLWTAVSASLYGGWVVGYPLRLAADAGALWRAGDAIAATGYNGLFAAALLAAALRVTRGAPNRLGVLAFVVFWAVHELAKLNVFFGVVNPGTQFLPSYLAHLQRYFGPARNSPLLAVSVLVLALAAAASVRRARRQPSGGRRVGAALLACVLALAALEHALLGTTRDLGWWNAFLAWRGAT